MTWESPHSSVVRACSPCAEGLGYNFIQDCNICFLCSPSLVKKKYGLFNLSLSNTMNSCSFSCTSYVNQLIHKNYRISLSHRQGQPGKETVFFSFYVHRKGFIIQGRKLFQLSFTIWGSGGQLL